MKSDKKPQPSDETKVHLEGHFEMSYYLISRADLEYLEANHLPQVDGLLALLIATFLSLVSYLFAAKHDPIVLALLSALIGGTIVATVIRHLVVCKRKQAFLAKIAEISERKARLKQEE